MSNDKYNKYPPKKEYQRPPAEQTPTIKEPEVVEPTTVVEEPVKVEEPKVVVADRVSIPERPHVEPLPAILPSTVKLTATLSSVAPIASPQSRLNIQDVRIRYEGEILVGEVKIMLTRPDNIVDTFVLGAVKPSNGDSPLSYALKQVNGRFLHGTYKVKMTYAGDAAKNIPAATADIGTVVFAAQVIQKKK